MIGIRENYNIKGLKLKNFINLNYKEKEIIRCWRNSCGIRKWMHTERIISKTEHELFIKSLKKDSKNFFWVVETENGEYIGVIYLNRVDFNNRNAYIGMYINPFLKGVGSRLMECLKELSLKIVKLHTLKLEVIETNKSAIKFSEKFGFKKEGCLQEFVSRNGKWCNVIIMGILRSHDKF
jgi:UDP-4-amino-4,6-dideoxy-N-acetyl-beta-L-altrosamine N-acetyltransferase